MDALEYLRLALDPGRLAVLGALAARPGTAEDIAQRAHQDRRATLAVLATLVQAGLASANEQANVQATERTNQQTSERANEQATQQTNQQTNPQTNPQTSERTYELDVEALRAIARDLPGPPPPHPRVGFGMTADEQQVLGRFFQGERLVEIPSTRSKRLVVLQRLALEFEPGHRYPEAEVNERLAGFHEDYASLRRYLVDEGFLDREAGKYWRSGGRMH